MGIKFQIYIYFKTQLTCQFSNKPFQYRVKDIQSIALRANVGTEEYDVKGFLKVSIDMALHRSNDLISCTFLKDWLRLKGVKKFFILLFHPKSLSVCFQVIKLTSLTITEK